MGDRAIDYLLGGDRVPCNFDMKDIPTGFRWARPKHYQQTVAGLLLETSIRPTRCTRSHRDVAGIEWSSDLFSLSKQKKDRTHHWFQTN